MKSRSSAFSENLFPRGIIPETAICLANGANETISLTVYSGELTDLRSLVPPCRITISGFDRISSMSTHLDSTQGKQ